MPINYSKSSNDIWSEYKKANKINNDFNDNSMMTGQQKPPDLDNKTWEVGKNLYNYAKQEEKLNQGLAADLTGENAIIEKYRKYAAQMNEVNGLEGLGVASSINLDLNNSLRNNTQTIKNNYTDNIYTLGQDTMNKEQSIIDKYREIYAQEAERVKNDVTEMLDGGNSYNNGYRTENGEITKDGFSAMDNYLKAQKAMLGDKYGETEYLLNGIYGKGSDGTAINKSPIISEEDIVNNMLDRTNLNGIDVNDAKVTSFGKYNDTGTGKGNQDKYALQIIKLAKNGQIPNGSYVNMNYGKGSNNTGNVYQYRDGKFYKTNLSGKSAKAKKNYYNFN